MGVASSTCMSGLQKDAVISSLRSALENKKWISDHMPRLREEYLHKYIAVNKSKVIAAADRQNALFDALEKKHVDMRVVVIEFVTDEGTIWVL